jgi:hypothetical protein
MKRNLAVLLVALLLAGALPAASADEENSKSDESDVVAGDGALPKDDKVPLEPGRGLAVSWWHLVLPMQFSM